MTNRYKTKCYKSAVQFFNTTDQPILATNTIVNPVTLALGSRVTDTGIAIDFNAFDVDVEASGLYRISANIDSLGVTGGDITFAIAENGIILPETITTITAVADISKLAPLETIRTVNVCCGNIDHNFSVIAYSDGTGVATVTRISGNMVKLA